MTSAMSLPEELRLYATGQIYEPLLNRAADEIEQLRAALSRVNGRAQIRDSATLLDIMRLIDEMLG